MATKKPPAPTMMPGKLVYTIPEAAAVLCVGKDAVYRLTSKISRETHKPLLESRYIGRRKVITYKALLAFLGLDEVA